MRRITESISTSVGDEDLGSATTDRNGTFVIRLPAGARGGLEPHDLDWQRTRITIKPDTRDLGRITLARAGRIQGRVVDAATGKPLASQRVFAQAQDTSQGRAGFRLVWVGHDRSRGTIRDWRTFAGPVQCPVRRQCANKCRAAIVDGPGGRGSRRVRGAARPGRFPREHGTPAQRQGLGQRFRQAVGEDLRGLLWTGTPQFRRRLHDGANEGRWHIRIPRPARREQDLCRGRRSRAA